MADVDRLYPPNIAGTLPSFYTDINGTTQLVVPFSMNQSVSVASVKGFFLRLKRTTTDTLLSVQSTSNWDNDNSQVTFLLSSDTVNKMTTGDYYKVQIAYYNFTPGGTPYCGYYSTVAIVKYTEQPTVRIQSLEPGIVNAVSSQQFVGQYKNPDISEKAYQYRFLINTSYSSDLGLVSETLLDTGWLIHNSTTDTELTYSTDTLTLTELLTTGVNYTIQYFIITNNGLQISSPQYSLAATQNLGEQIPCRLISELDYDNARIKVSARSLYVVPANTNIANLTGAERLKYYFNGTYQLIRTDSKSNFKTWTLLNVFEFYGLFQNWTYWDYIVESGVTYRYGLQKINANNVRSARCETASNITAYFEDSFLYDGTKQLRIRYNSNVSSIKNVIAESKKTTLGSKYPYILRNGYLNYKEFPFTGLLSYLSDNEELFMTKDELIHPSSRFVGNNNSFMQTTDQTDQNVTAEKNFALAALDWLNNGSIKLFKSSQEGNYIVKCTNNSLAPVQNTNRMLHTFTCTISEVQEYTTTALIKYNLLSASETTNTEGHVWINQIERIIIQDKLRYEFWETTELERRRPLMAEYDFTQGKYVNKIEITDATPGDLFKYGDNTFAIPQSGKYTIINDEPLVQPLYKTYIVVGTSYDEGGHLITEVLPAAYGQTDQGIITLYYQIDTTVTFEAIAGNNIKTYYGWSGYGAELTSNGEQSDNILWEFVGPKKTIINMYNYVIHTYPTCKRVNVAYYAGEDMNNFGVKYDGYLYLQDIGENPEYEHYKYDKDLNEFVPYDNYNILFRAGGADKSLINISSYSTDDDVYLPGIDYTDKEQAYWTIGQDLFVSFFMQVQETTYAIESTNQTVYAAKLEAESARLDYYKKLWNFEILATKPSSSTQIYIYNNDHFSAIPYSDWDNYDEHYKVSDSTYTKEQIDNAYTTYRQKQQAFDTILQYYITRETGGI